MKIQPYVEKLNISKEYKDFQTKNKDAFLVAGFFILDFELGKNLHQIDFYIPSKRKIAAFTLDSKITMQILDMIESDHAPEKMDLKIDTDLDALQGIVQDEMKNRNMTEEIKKMIAVVQNIDGKKIWNINCVLSGMEILKAHIEDESQTVLKMERISIMDVMKKLPMNMLPAGMTNKVKGLKEAAGLADKAVAKGDSGESGEDNGGEEDSVEGGNDDRIKQLEKIKQAIEQEEESYKKSFSKKKKKS